MNSSISHIDKLFAHSVMGAAPQGSIKGVGPKTAQQLVDEYGDTILEVLDSQDAVSKLCKIKRLGRSRARQIKESWDSVAGARQATIFLSQHGVSDALTQKVVKVYGSQAEEEVRKDPYRALMAVRHKAYSFT